MVSEDLWATLSVSLNQPMGTIVHTDERTNEQEIARCKTLLSVEGTFSFSISYTKPMAQ
jgi:hypothetical protein